ncbi:hypothetical protein EJ02DRAFT_514097 [Clathrospora elynae]|uniref:Uncharacterized protein n=1 Tax=Clathrospora elynae TaxID=706981 RepID=A0A6A5SEI2_9PLEO|nr:hypothetical protein EJ02DRAFT_514097 [Clathrospora elynae]
MFGAGHKLKETGHFMSIDYWALSYVDSVFDEAQDNTDNWDAIMKQAGIKSEIRSAFEKYEYRTIYGIQPLNVWLTEIIEIFYEIFEELNARVLQELEPSSGPSLRGGHGEEQYKYPQIPGGHLALFKSVEFSKVKKFFAVDGSVNLRRLESEGPTDFARRGGLYFTHQLWAAK